MKTKKNKLKTYICLNCKNKNESIGIIQQETHYYSFDLNTKQKEDFHGDESVESQELFCLSCKSKINDNEVDF